MFENETDPKKIATALIEEHDIQPNYAESSVEDPLVELAITSYSRQLEPHELLEIILQTKRDIAKPEEFMARFCVKKHLTPDDEMVELLECMVEFIVTRAVEAAFEPVAA